MHFVRQSEFGTAVSVSLAKVITDRRVVGLLEFSNLRSKIFLNFLNPFFIELRKASIVVHSD